MTTTPTIVGHVFAPGSSPATDCKVLIEVYASVGGGPAIAFAPASQLEIVGREQVVPDSAGNWTFKPRPNIELQPVNSVYKATYLRAGLNPVILFFTAPNDNGTHWVGDLLVDPPGSLPSGALAEHIASTTAHPAAHITFDPTGRAILTATNVQDALGQVDFVLNAHEARIEALEAGGGGGGGGTITQFIDPSQTPYNCDMSGATKSGGNGTARDGHDSTHGFLKACHDAATSGRIMWLPPGTVDVRKDDGTSALEGIDLSVFKRRVKVMGCGEQSTTLSWPATLGLVTDPTDLTLGGDPSGRVANIAMDAFQSNNTDWSLDISDLTLKGPGNYTGNPTDTENRQNGWGLRMGGRIRVERVYITQWHSGIVFRVREGTNHDHNIDHNTIKNSRVDFNWYNAYWSYYWPVSGANSGDGDHVIENVMMSQASKACRAFDPAAIAFNSKFTSCHAGFSPFVNYSEFGPQGTVLLPTSGSIATVNRNGTGVITIQTQLAAQACPWGPFDSSDEPWNWGTIVAGGGFVLGDVVDLSSITTTGHAAGTLSSDGKCTGRVTGKTGTTLTITMENPIETAFASAENVTGGGIVSHYNNTRWLDSNTEFDGTYEGWGVSAFYAPNRNYSGSGTTTSIPSQGPMTVDNNKGSTNSYSPTPIYSLSRTGGVVTGKVPLATPMSKGDNWFIDTPTAGTWLDDNPPASGWSARAGRIRGCQTITSVVAGTGGDSDKLIFTFNQAGSTKTLGDGTGTSWDPTNHPLHGSAGGCGRVAFAVVSSISNCIGMTLDTDTHPPDNANGGPLAAVEVVFTQMHKCLFNMQNGQAIYPRLMSNTTDTSPEPVRSSCVGEGGEEAPITHCLADIAPGMVVEYAGKDDVRPYQGGMLAGINLYDRLNGDFTCYKHRGYLSSKDTFYPTPGVLSTVSFGQGDIIYADASNHGYCIGTSGRDSANDPRLGRATSPSTSLGGGLFMTSVRIDIGNLV